MIKTTKATKKKRRRSGFSLAEVLIAILIMAMVTTVVAGSIPAAINSYKKITRQSNAQLLMSTTVNTLRGWLDQAEIDADATDNDTIVFSSAGIGTCRITVTDGASTGNGIWIEEYMDSSLSYPARLLVSEASGGGDLYTVFGDASYDPSNGVISITGIYVKDAGGNTVLGPTSFSTKTLGIH